MVAAATASTAITSVKRLTMPLHRNPIFPAMNYLEEMSPRCGGNSPCTWSWPYQPGRWARLASPTPRELFPARQFGQEGEQGREERVRAGEYWLGGPCWPPKKRRLWIPWNGVADQLIWELGGAYELQRLIAAASYQLPINWSSCQDCVAGAMRASELRTKQQLSLPARSHSFFFFFLSFFFLIYSLLLFQSWIPLEWPQLGQTGWIPPLPETNRTSKSGQVRAGRNPSVTKWPGFFFSNEDRQRDVIGHRGSCPYVVIPQHQVGLTALSLRAWNPALWLLGWVVSLLLKVGSMRSTTSCVWEWMWVLLLMWLLPVSLKNICQSGFAWGKKLVPTRPK